MDHREHITLRLVQKGVTNIVWPLLLYVSLFGPSAEQAYCYKPKHQTFFSSILSRASHFLLALTVPIQQTVTQLCIRYVASDVPSFSQFCCHKWTIASFHPFVSYLQAPVQSVLNASAGSVYKVVFSITVRASLAACHRMRWIPSGRFIAPLRSQRTTTDNQHMPMNINSSLLCWLYDIQYGCWWRFHCCAVY